MISHDNKFIFIQIPKTGSDSVCACLLSMLGKRDMMRELSNPELFMRKNHHSTLEQILTTGDSDISDYYTFTFVRNPFDRVLSEYLYIPKYLKQVETGIIPRICDNLKGYKSDKFKKQFKTFKDYVTRDDGLIFIDLHDKQQIKYTESGRMDFIGRFENLQQDFNIVCDKTGLPRQQLPHYNKTRHKHYTEYYDDETRQIVAERYAKDIERFDYEFGE